MEICSKCGGAVEQLISAPTIQFKGSGWYVTDYSKKSGSPAPSSGANNGKGEVKAESSKSETKTESKPSEKTASKDKK